MSWAVALDALFGVAVRRPTTVLTYGELRRAFFGPSGRPAPPPGEPTPSRALLEDYRTRVAPHHYNPQFARSFGYFTPPPLPLSVVGELLAQWANQSVDIWQAGPIAALVEEEVCSWLAEMVGHPEGQAVLTSGGVMANLMALTVARDVGLGRLVDSTAAPRGADLERARVYASDQAHFSIARALDILGFPAESLVVLPSDDDFRLRADVVARAVAADREGGLVPFAIAAVCGSTNTGSIDALGDLADLAADQDLWLHVDAAYGGAVRLSPGESWRADGLERADSVTVDPHKWLYQAADVGALVVRRGQDLTRTFHRTPEYYRRGQDEEGDEALDWYALTMEGTRRFRGLKLWMSWRHLGTAGLGRLVDANLELARYLAARCREAEEFDILPEEPELSVVCLRHLPGGVEAARRMSPEALDQHQDEVQRALEVSGEGWLSTTRLRGRTYLRAGVVNYLSTERDVDHLLNAIRRLGGSGAEGIE
jgi:glutamate/tyrosine decarboxylase-like PLP-dependent enzyme